MDGLEAKIGYVQVVRAPCISPGIFDYVYISKLRLNAAATYSLCVEKEIRYCKNSEMMMNPWCGIKGSNVTLPLSCPSPAFVRKTGSLDLAQANEFQNIPSRVLIILIMFCKNFSRTQRPFSNSWQSRSERPMQFLLCCLHGSIRLSFLA